MKVIIIEWNKCIYLENEAGKGFKVKPGCFIKLKCEDGSVISGSVRNILDKGLAIAVDMGEQGILYDDMKEVLQVW